MNNKRIIWVDYLKVLAIIGVLGIHSSSILLENKYIFTIPWYQSVISASIFRFAIILFIMASGYLLLRKTQPISSIPRRLKRILIPFIFWLLVYALIKIFFKGDLGSSWTIIDLLSYIGNALLNPLDICVQFWYVYMILGLYLLLPIISGWIQNTDIKEIEYFLSLWVMASLVQFIGIETVLMDYMRYFTGSIGYFVLGYYLTIKKNELLTDKRFGLLLFLIGSLITIMGTIIFSYWDYNQSLFFIRLGDITPGACLQAVGLFIIVKNIDYTRLDQRINSIVTRISEDSYGIYMVNILVINLLEKLQLINYTNYTMITILFVMFIVLVMSTMIIELLYKIPFLRAFSGRI